MKHTILNPTIVFLTGLAFGLQNINRILPEGPPDLRAYLSPLSSKFSKKQLERLMQHAVQLSVTYPKQTTEWVNEYLEHPLRESDYVKSDAFSYFTSERKNMSEDSLDIEILNPEGLTLGGSVYEENKGYFDLLIINLWHIHPLTLPEENFGLLFIQTSD